MLSRPLQLLLGVTIALVAYAWWQDQAIEPELDTHARSAIPVAAIPNPASAISAMTASKPTTYGASFAVNLFPKQTWAPTPTPAPISTPGPAAPTPIPVAPPLPFTVAATWHEKGVDEFVLAANDQQYVICRRCDALGRVQLGETLLGLYRIDEVSRQQIVFTYLPLNQQQVLPIGGTP